MLRQARWRLRPPPRTLSNLGISRFAPKGPELAGCVGGAVVSAETNSGVEEDFGRVVSGLEIPFPGNGDAQAETQFECMATPSRAQASGVDETIRLSGRKGEPLPFREGAVHRWLPSRGRVQGMPVRSSYSPFSGCISRALR